MLRRKRTNEALDECLRLLQEESLSLEECLELYPDLADELVILLTTAIALKSSYSINPSPEFQERAAQRFRQEISRLPTVRPSQAASQQYHLNWRSVSLALGVLTGVALMIWGSLTIFNDGSSVIVRSAEAASSSAPRKLPKRASRL